MANAPAAKDDDHKISRLYPLHLLTLLFMAMMQAVYLAKVGAFYVYQDNDVYHFILQLFLASNWVLIPESFNSPIWSISVEVLGCLTAVAYLRLRLSVRG